MTLLLSTRMFTTSRACGTLLAFSSGVTKVCNGGERNKRLFSEFMKTKSTCKRSLVDRISVLIKIIACMIFWRRSRECEAFCVRHGPPTSVRDVSMHEALWAWRFCKYIGLKHLHQPRAEGHRYRHEHSMRAGETS